MRAALCALLLAVSCSALTTEASAETKRDVAGAGPAKAAQWQWNDTGGDEPLMVVVNLATQRTAVFRGESRVGHSIISSGKAGKETPTGVFPILQKKKDHISNLYNRPMPYMQRLTWDGIALHAGRATGRPLSHGCIRFPTGFARALFAATRHGTTVVVLDEPAADGRDEALASPQIALQAIEEQQLAAAPEPAREADNVVLASASQP